MKAEIVEHIYSPFIARSCGRFCAGPIQMPEGLKRSTRAFFNRAAGRMFQAKGSGDVVEIDLYDEIGGWGVTADAFRRELRSVSAKNITLRVNSPGGDVFDGIAMHNDLAEHPARVRVEVSGLAASAASLIAMAGDEIAVASNAFMMVHNAWGVAIGNRHEFAEMIELLEQVDGALAQTYAARTEMDIGAVEALMDAETWLNADDAVDSGFADEVIGSSDVEARFDLSQFKNVPKSVPRLGAMSSQPRTVRDHERCLRDAGYSRSNAKQIASMICKDLRSDLRDAGGSEETTAALQQLLSTIKGAST